MMVGVACCSGCRRVTVAGGTQYAAEPVVDLNQYQGENYIKVNP